MQSGPESLEKLKDSCDFEILYASPEISAIQEASTVPQQYSSQLVGIVVNESYCIGIGKILNLKVIFFLIRSLLTCYDSLSCTCFSSGVFSLRIDICTVGL